MSKEEVDALVAEGKQYVVRFKIEPNEDVHVHDIIRGEVVINSSILDDKVLYKSADELPTYHQMMATCFRSPIPPLPAPHIVITLKSRNPVFHGQVPAPVLLSLKKLTIPFPHHTCFHPFNNV